VEAPTPWELHRNYESLRTDVRQGFAGLNTRLDRVPTEQTLTALIARLDDRVSGAESDVAGLQADLKAERTARQMEQAANRRMMIGAVLAGVVSLAVMLVSSLIGGGVA
jgi:hypothetical protein